MAAVWRTKSAPSHRFDQSPPNWFATFMLPKAEVAFFRMNSRYRAFGRSLYK